MIYDFMQSGFSKAHNGLVHAWVVFICIFHLHFASSFLFFSSTYLECYTHCYLSYVLATLDYLGVDLLLDVVTL